MNNDPQFNGFKRASGDYIAVQNRLKTELLAYELDLSVARTFSGNTFADLNFAGNAFYVDQETDVGNASVLFADQPMPGTIVPMKVVPGSICRAPFTRLMIANLAQPGKKLRFFYGVDVDFAPGFTGQTTVTGALQVTEQGSNYAASFVSNALLAVGANEVIVAPASNVNGVILYRASMYSGNGTGQPFPALLAKSSAPASNIDGDLLLAPENFAIDGANRYCTCKLERIVRVSAGKGLYFRNGSGILETGAMRSAQYTIL